MVGTLVRGGATATALGLEMARRSGAANVCVEADGFTTGPGRFTERGVFGVMGNGGALRRGVPPWRLLGFRESHRLAGEVVCAGFARGAGAGLTGVTLARTEISPFFGRRLSSDLYSLLFGFPFVSTTDGFSISIVGVDRPETESKDMSSEAIVESSVAPVGARSRMAAFGCLQGTSFVAGVSGDKGEDFGATCSSLKGLSSSRAGSASLPTFTSSSSFRRRDTRPNRLAFFFFFLALFLTDLKWFGFGERVFRRTKARKKRAENVANAMIVESIVP